jgi:hypothetical protein
MKDMFIFGGRLRCSPNVDDLGIRPQGLETDFVGTINTRGRSGGIQATSFELCFSIATGLDYPDALFATCNPPFYNVAHHAILR